MYLLNSLLIGTTIFGFLLLTAVARNQNTAKFQKFICTLCDKTVITNYSCTTKPVSRYKTTIGFSAFGSRPVHGIMVHIKVYKKFNVVYKPFLVDVKENVCDALAKKPGAAPYTRLGLELYGSHINLNHTCPYQGWIMVKNMDIDFTKLKLVIPSGEYRTNLDVTLNKSPLITFSVKAFLEIGETDPQQGK